MNLVWHLIYIYLYEEKGEKEKEGVCNQEESLERAGDEGLGFCLICVSVSHGNKYETD